MSDWNIRRAGVADIEAIVALWTALQELTGTLDARLRVNGAALSKFAAHLRHGLEFDKLAAYLAETANEPIGFALGQVCERPAVEPVYGYITDLYVRPDSRRAGVGRALFEHLRDWFAGSGIAHIEVQTVRANLTSHAFWRKMGFSEYLRTLRN